jgi:hypothetical protein
MIAKPAREIAHAVVEGEYMVATKERSSEYERS